MPRRGTGRERRIVLWCTVLTAVLVGCQDDPSDHGASQRATAASVPAAAVWVAERVDVGGHELNLLCRGSGSPTIVFENGLGANLGTWFQTDVANGFSSVRTCAYDRVNAGTSDRDPGRHSGEDSVRDLHTLLQVAAVPAPYLLVGHSFGGLLAVMYAGTHPAEVAGLVLLDPSLPTQVELFDLLPERERAAEIADQEKNPENVDFFDTLDQAKALVPRVPDIPVLVLAATNLGDIPPPWPTEGFLPARKKALQEFTAALPQGELRYVASGHAIHSAEPKLVISEIQRALENVR